MRISRKNNREHSVLNGVGWSMLKLHLNVYGNVEKAGANTEI